MRIVRLGERGPAVSRFCLGLLSLSPLQADLPRPEAVRLVEDALAAGVTFFDTAEIYRTYPLVRDVLRPPAVVATKAYAYSYDGMRESLRRALAETGRDRIDIFLLHEQESALTLAGHAEALRCLVEAREAGVVGAVGVSTHAPAVVDAAAEMEEIDVIHPLVNHRGLGLLEGTLEQMLAAIAKAGRAGKGIYAMKVLGGGHLAVGDQAVGDPAPGTLAPAEQAFSFIRGIPDVQAVAVGAKNRDELLYDIALLEGGASREELDALAAKVGRHPRRLLIEDWCEGCGKCIETCRYGALTLAAGDAGQQRAVVDQARCVLCGYCAAACRDFFIKVL